ncbi:MAG: LacI family DNA-binding transcriptional regulator [Anaerolineae bacterium]|nr:LacI family DNA-binding transcriptional regulator [Anaerolineae bacterium]
MALTLEEVAQKAGVSRSTVSRVVNEHPNVRDQVRERVWQIIHDTGYQPHAAARSLVTRRTRIIAVIIPESVNTLLGTPFFSRFLTGITHICNLHEYNLMLSLFDSPKGQREMYQRVLGSGYLDGVIVASTPIDDPLIPQLLEDKVPWVLAGRHPDERVNYVDVDNVLGARMAVEHLIRLGHRRIATISGPLNMISAQDRLQGYRQALEAYRIPVDPALIVEGDYSEDGGEVATKRLLPISPTAIFAASDSMASGALKSIREAGLRAPDDIALVGFDDIALSTSLEPALTTVRQPIEDLGSMAADLLLNMLENPPGDRAPAHKMILPVKLIVRASCGALR